MSRAHSKIAGAPAGSGDPGSIKLKYMLVDQRGDGAPGAPPGTPPGIPPIIDC
jgi:hypothetical protein